MMLCLARNINDDLCTIFSHIPKNKKSLITSDQNIKEVDKNHLKKHFKNVIFIDNYDSDEIYFRAIELYKSVPYDRIVTSATGEFDILRAGRLRDYLKIKGQNYASALHFRDKYVMKKILKENNISVPQFKSVSTYIDIQEFIGHNGYPLVIKPRTGVASINTFIIKNQDDLIESLKKINFQNDYYMIEQFIDGKMFHIDGLIEDGKLRAIWPSEYLKTAMDMMNGEYFANFLLESNNSVLEKLIDFTKKILSVLPTPKTTAFHLECFQNKKGEFVFCEIASRAAGGYTSLIWDNAFQIPLRYSFYQMQAGLKLKDINKNLSPCVIPGSIVIPKKTGILKEISQSCPFSFVKKYVVFHKEGDEIKDSSSTMNALLSALIIGSTEKDLKEKFNIFLKWVQGTVHYE